MATSYDDAVTTLYRAPLGDFVAERKRLAAELKRDGDPGAATRLGKLARPTVSVWAVNQLWWHESTAFKELFVTADRLRRGDLAATAAHRDVTAKLRARAAALLGEAGHSATDATLRRVTTTLSALAAAGGFEPDPAGALSTDRDPPGFDAFGSPAMADASPVRSRSARPANDARPAAGGAQGNKGPSSADRHVQRRREAELEAARRAEAARERRRLEEERAAERRRLEQEQAKQLAERRRLEAELKSARTELQARTRELERLRTEVADADARVERARAAMQDLEAQLAKASRW